LQSHTSLEAVAASEAHTRSSFEAHSTPPTAGASRFVSFGNADNTYDRRERGRERDQVRASFNAQVGVDELLGNEQRFEETVGNTPGLPLSTSTPGDFHLTKPTDKDKQAIETAALNALYKERSQRAESENETLRKQLADARTAESFVRDK
jgi:hypothetical protein